jgi:asparagine synthetase B (glutamine-hydrolysing)
VIAGVFEAAGEPAADARGALGDAAAERRAGPLRVAWGGRARAHEADGVLCVLDGFLVGSSPRLEGVVALWRAEGTSLAKRLRGAFTLLIWDERERRGAVVCDQFSLRVCLMHGSESGQLRFATHLPALRRLLPRDPAPEARVIAPWIAPHYLQGHLTMMEGVERVGAARLLELGEKGWVRHRYWRPEWREPMEASEGELVDLMRGELRRAVSERIEGAGRTGAILSGGVDSSVVLATAAGLEPRPDLRAYSAVFPDWPPADESERIIAATSALDVPSARFAVRPQGALRLALEQLRDAGTVPGGPGGVVEHPGVRQAAADGVDVLLDGQGGDEVFGKAPYLIADRLRRGNLVDAARLVRLLLPYRRTRRQKAVVGARLLLEFGVRPALGRPPRRGDAPEWLSERSAHALDEAHAPWPWRTDEPVPRSWAYHSYLLSDHVEGSGLGEHIWERGARFGLRSGAPLFDVGLVELVLRFPQRVQWQRTDRPIARAAVAGALPDSVRLNRTKANISPFYLDLLTGPDAAMIRELLLDSRARVREFADPVWIDSNVPRCPTRADPDWLMWTTVVWRLATAECWLRWLEDEGFPAAVLERPDLPRPSATRV